MAEEIFSRFPATLELTVAALGVMVLLAVPAGILAALYRHEECFWTVKLLTKDDAVYVETASTT